MIENKELVMPIVTFDKEDGWDTIKDITYPHLDSEGFDFLKKALAESASSVAVEKHYLDKDYRDTFTGYHARKFATPDSRCIRLHFFGASITADQLANAVDEEKKKELQYLGYSIIRPTRPNCIGRTMLSPAAQKHCSGHICLSQEEVSIQGTRLEVQGFPFIKQDTDATVCAESALWMLLRYFSNRYPQYKEFYPFEITNLTKDYSLGRIFPSAGLHTWQMGEALRLAGFHPLIYESEFFSANFKQLLYTYIESGFPLLIVFEDHVVVGFGHDSDFNKLKNESEVNKDWYCSSEFNTAFVINDDNKVPYMLLKDTSDGDNFESRYRFKNIEAFIVPLPEKVFLPAEAFQDAAVTILRYNDVFNVQSKSAIFDDAQLILRSYLTTCRSFKENLRERTMGHKLVENIYRQLPLPHFIWVCEISQPDLYPEYAVGEILWDATRNGEEPEGLIAVHYPVYFAYDLGNCTNQPFYLEEISLTESNPYATFRSNLWPVK